MYEDMDTTQKYTSGFEIDVSQQNAGELDISLTELEVDIANIDLYPNQEYALLRKNGLGTSDSSIVLGVNPYTTKSQLIQEKCRDYLTPEELEVGDKSAVRKGRELEPLIIAKWTQIIGRRVLKPIHMYKHKDYPYIKFNFDGVIDIAPNQNVYIPAEIKVVTLYGVKHYNLAGAVFSESTGWRELPPHYEELGRSIEDTAALYGIPPYYYTQLQQQIFGLNAPYGFLTVMFEKNWEVHSWFVWRDQRMINKLIVEDNKTWNAIEAKRPEGFDLGVTIKEEEE